MTQHPPLDTLSDEDLMLAYQRGDAKAFEILLKRYHRPIYNLVYRFAGNSQTAEDVAQEVFIRVIRSAANYTQQAKFKTWLFTIARNLCIDTARKNKYRQTFSLDQPLDHSDEGRTVLDTVASDNPGSDRDLSDKQFKACLEEALGALNPEQREVFVMRQFNGLPFKEIAEITGTSENTVKSRMRYALETLREALKDFE